MMIHTKKGNLSSVSIHRIDVNPNQPRVEFDDEYLQELSSSIREFGVIQPLIVKRAGRERFELIAGERRLRAAGMAGLTRVPVVIRDVDEQESALIALIENVQRENLSFLEEAMAYKKLMEVHGLTQSQIAARVGKKQSTISNKLRVLALPEDIRQVITKENLSERHARALLRVEDPEARTYILQRIVKNHLNVTQTEKLISDLIEKGFDLGKAKGKGKERVRYINYRIYINTIKKSFEMVAQSEKNARFYQEDQGDMVEIRIQIPKTEEAAMCNNL